MLVITSSCESVSNRKAEDSAHSAHSNNRSKITVINKESHFIDTVRLFSKTSIKSINLDTLNAEHFPLIPFAFFKKYYSKYIGTTEYNISTPPNDNIYWRFSFLSFDYGELYDFQKIIGYFEESGTYIYLVVLDKITHEVLKIHQIAYTGGDGAYGEVDLLTTIDPKTYQNQHTIMETDESSFEEDSIRTNLLIQTLRLTMTSTNKLRVDTVAQKKKVELSYNEANQRKK